MIPKTVDKKLAHAQYRIQPIPFDGYNKDLPIQQALGARRGKEVQQSFSIQSTNWKKGVSGWRLGPRGIEFGASSGVFPPGTIKFTDIQNIATAKILGRNTAGSGSIEELSPATVKTLLAIVAANISDFVEAAQDAVGSILNDSATIDFTYNDAGNAITAITIQQMSVTADASGLKLSGDASSPGNLKYYGTNSSGTKGWNALTNPVLDTKSLTAQTADIADTALTTTGAGLYRINYYLLDTTADLTAGAVTLNIKFTDAATARTISSAAVILTATTGFTQGEIIAQLASGSLTYGVTHSGIFGTAAYALYLTIERII